MQLLITCEHGGNEVPARYAALFEPHRALLATHRGYDAGALHLAGMLSKQLGAPMIASTVTRLLVDLNRSAHHPKVFSEATRGLTKREREGLIEHYHRPHREQVMAAVDRVVEAGGRLVHVGVHSFTPVLDGEVRNADIGLLYDPARANEKAFCRQWGTAIQDMRPGLVVRYNYPYRGHADGLTTTLRRRHAKAASRYLGIELEMNTALLPSVAKGADAMPGSERFPPNVVTMIAQSLASTLKTFDPAA